MSKKKNLKDFDIDKILENTREPIKYEIVDAMNDWGLEYAYSTLLDRALVYNYDFVKPVQLRSIWGMYKQGLRPDKGNIKEGQVQATIMGKYHPHSDCLYADTCVYLVDGTTKTIKEMYDETLVDPNKTYNVYSINKKGRLIHSILSHARIGQYTDKIYKVTLSNGMVVKTTSNHPFMLFDKTYRKAEDLIVGDIVASGELVKNTNNSQTINMRLDSDVTKSNVIVSVENIEIIDANQEPMYDFTVDNYENALFIDDKKENFVVLHNSSIKGVLDGWAQAFNSRVPLVKTTGQPGRFTGDSAPAARYLEVGMNKACYELVRDTQNHGCLWTFNEQGDEIMPLTLPARWPLGIINGTQGIATGFACNIPPHNPDEVMKACAAYLNGKIDKPSKVHRYIQGPDFPTGATVIGVDGIKQYLETGEGKFIIKGKYSIKELSKGRVEIDFTELPYNVSVEQVMTDINNKKKKNGKFVEISETKDLSDRRFQTDKSEVKLAIYVKSGANINKVIDDLYQYTRCQVSYSVNATTIIDNKPHMNTSVYEMIIGFCNMRKDVYKLRSKYRLKVIEKDLHILDGLLKVLVDIDEAIKIIRNSENSDIASEKLQKKFKVDSVQANQILLMTLKQLTKADSIEIQQKQRSLVEENKSIHNILSNETLLNNEIIKELQDTLKVISSPRRTEIIGISMEELKQQQKDVEKQNKLLAKGVECYVNVHNGQIGKSIDKNNKSVFSVMSDSNIFIVGKDGNCKELSVEKVPLDSLQNISTFTNGNEDIAGITSDTNYETLVVSNLGNINVFKNKFKSGLLCKLKDEELMLAVPINNEIKENHSLIMINKHGDLFKMDIHKLKSVNAGSGLITGTKMKDIIYVGLVSHNDIIKTVSNNEIKYTSIEECPSKGRCTSGYLLHKLKKNDEIVSCEIVEMSDNVVLTSRGKNGIKIK